MDRSSSSAQGQSLQRSTDTRSVGTPQQVRSNQGTRNPMPVQSPYKLRLDQIKLSESQNRSASQIDENTQSTVPNIMEGTFPQSQESTQRGGIFNMESVGGDSANPSGVAAILQELSTSGQGLPPIREERGESGSTMANTTQVMSPTTQRIAERQRQRDAEDDVEETKTNPSQPSPLGRTVERVAEDRTSYAQSERAPAQAQGREVDTTTVAAEHGQSQLAEEVQGQTSETYPSGHQGSQTNLQTQDIYEPHSYYQDPVPKEGQEPVMESTNEPRDTASMEVEQSVMPGGIPETTVTGGGTGAVAGRVVRGETGTIPRPPASRGGTSRAPSARVAGGIAGGTRARGAEGGTVRVAGGEPPLRRAGGAPARVAEGTRRRGRDDEDPIVWNNMSPKFFLADPEEVDHEEDLINITDLNVELTWWSGHSASRVKTLQDMKNLVSWLCDKQGHVQYLNIARCLLKIIQAQPNGNATLNAFLNKHQPDLKGFTDFLLEANGAHFPISSFANPAFEAVCGGYPNNYTLARFAMLKELLASFFVDIFQSILGRSSFENKMKVGDSGHEVVSFSNQNWNLLSTTSSPNAVSTGWRPGVVNDDGATQFFASHFTTPSAEVPGTVGNENLGDFISPAMSTDRFPSATSITMNLVGEFCQADTVESTFNNEYAQNNIKIGVGSFSSANAKKTNIMTKKGYEVTDLRSLMLLDDSDEDSILVTKMRVQFYINKFSTEARVVPNEKIKIITEFMDLNSDMSLKAQSLMEQAGEFDPENKNMNSYMSSFDLWSSMRITAQLSWNLLAKFINNDGFLFPGPLVSVSNLEFKDVFTQYLSFEALTGKPYLLSLFMFALHLKGLAHGSLKAAERDVTKKGNTTTGKNVIEFVKKKIY